MSLLTIEREGVGTPLLWLHGFTQTRDSARKFRSILAGHRELLTLDLPGHGSASAVHASLEQTADLVAAAIGAETVDLGGYSYGARVALHVALAHPENVRRLVLLGASRGIEDVNERAARRARDEDLARRIESDGVDAFLSDWLAQPLFSRLAGRAELEARSHDASGLAASLRHSGTGTQAWLESRLRELSMPVLAMAGELDEKFAREARAIADGVRQGTYAEIPRAGHAAHLEEPERCAEAIEDFLSS